MLLGQQVVAICIVPYDVFILNSDACLFRLAWILTVFEMLVTAKSVSEVITRIGVSLLLGSCTNLAGPDISSGLQLSPTRSVITLVSVYLCCPRQNLVDAHENYNRKINIRH